jgi:hypothetical protein
MNKSNRTNPKRMESIEKFGYDVKFAYHIVRLLLEIEQIMAEGTLDLERNSEILKSIRRGEWTFQKIAEWFQTKELSLETLYSNSKLSNRPNEKEIKQILIECLEMHYGSLDKVIEKEKRVEDMVFEIENVLLKYKS